MDKHFPVYFIPAKLLDQLQREWS